MMNPITAAATAAVDRVLATIRPDVNGQAGDRIRVTSVDAVEAEPVLYAGATGTILNVYATAIAVRWDDIRLALADVTLLVGIDKWEIIHG